MVQRTNIDRIFDAALQTISDVERRARHVRLRTFPEHDGNVNVVKGRSSTNEPCR